MRRSVAYLIFFLAVSIMIAPATSAQTTAQSRATTSSRDTTPIVTGITWQRLNPNEKVAFVWGIGQLASVEREFSQRKGDTNVLGYRFAQGIRGVPMNDIVQQVDRYYDNNPDQLDKPVLRVVWETVAKPNLALNR